MFKKKKKRSSEGRNGKTASLPPGSVRNHVSKEIMQKVIE